MDETFDLERFVAAQATVIGTAMEELRAGRKQSHWIWFVFPQLRGLGRSSIAQHYAILSMEHAEAYLAHPVLGPRLIECTKLVNRIDGYSAEQIFGALDALKFRSSMTLFRLAAADSAVFEEALNKYFGGQPDPLTLQLLGR